MRQPSPRACAAVLALALASVPAAHAQAAHAQAAAPGTGSCWSVIEHWRGAAGGERQAGRMALSDDNAVENEIDRATALCQSGRDAEAKAMMAGSSHGHGFRPAAGGLTPGDR